MLVFALSFRLRRRELETMAKIGGGRGTIALVLACEIAFVGVFAMAGAALLTALATAFGQSLVRVLLSAS